MKPRKCELFYPEADDEEWTNDLKRQKDGIVVLGAALGSKDFVGASMLRFHTRLRLKGILSLQSKQCAFLLLKHCANSRIAHNTTLSPADHARGNLQS